MKKSFYDVIHSARVGSKPKFVYDIPLEPAESLVKRLRYSEKQLWGHLYALIIENDPGAHLVRLSSDTRAGIPDVWFSVCTKAGMTVHGFWELKIATKRRNLQVGVDFSEAQYRWQQSRSSTVSTALVYFEGRLYRVDSWYKNYLLHDLAKLPSVKWPNPSWNYFEKLILNPE